MLRRSAHVNVGIATGPVGLLVVDLDLPKSGDSPGTLVGQTELTELGVRAGRDVSPPPTPYARPLAGGTCTSPFPPAHGRTDRSVGRRGWRHGWPWILGPRCVRSTPCWERARGDARGVDFLDPLPVHSPEAPRNESGPASREGKPALTWCFSCRGGGI
ncbi:bifunctional DNA primase/polymerase [Streptomyces sp. LN499]|uniref:bifunctional DNA primase/polymerase n=1 Tax=Streptomyces sp. LN499 TaxID=3112977 RepID=UPI003711E2F8